MVVVVVAAILGGILGGLDIGFGWLLEKILID
jgi:preprotein translocase subunit SecE